MQSTEPTKLCLSCKDYRHEKQHFDTPSVFREMRVRHVCATCGSCLYESGGEWKLYAMTIIVFSLSLTLFSLSSLITMTSGALLSAPLVATLHRLSSASFYVGVGTLGALAYLIFKDIIYPTLRDAIASARS